MGLVVYSVEIKMRIRNKLIDWLLFFIFCSNLSAIKISEVEGTKRLSNYNEIKDIEVERIIDYDNYKRDEEKNLVFVTGETTPFTGMIIRKKGSIIDGLGFYKNGKREGTNYFYDINGKITSKNTNHNDVLIRSEFKHKNGSGMYSIYEQIKDNYGIKTNYYKNGQMAAKMNVRVEYKDKMNNYINEGESIAYEKNGEIKGILNFKNGSAYGLPQKLFKNGKLKYEFISAAEVGEKLETMTYFKEYFDKSDKLKLDCDEVSSGEWHCKEYKKDGTLKNEFTSPTYKPKKDNSFWINAFLGIWNILF